MDLGVAQTSSAISLRTSSWDVYVYKLLILVCFDF